MSRLPTSTTISPARDGDVLEQDRGTLWRLGFIKRFDEKSSSTNTEHLTQGELLTLWQQIGVLFNLGGMRNGLTDDDIEKMGIFRK